MIKAAASTGSCIPTRLNPLPACKIAAGCYGPAAVALTASTEHPHPLHIVTLMPTDNDTPTPLAATGERLMTDNRSHNLAEHLHRYAIALQFAHGRSVLDIASGEGYGSHLLAGRASVVFGVDVAADAVAHAAHKYRRDNLRYLQGSGTSIPLDDHSVDLVVSFETIEHLL
jgi:SAM-dependent methyltransferase